MSHPFHLCICVYLCIWVFVNFPADQLKDTFCFICEEKGAGEKGEDVVTLVDIDHQTHFGFLLVATYKCKRHSKAICYHRTGYILRTLIVSLVVQVNAPTFCIFCNLVFLVFFTLYFVLLYFVFLLCIMYFDVINGQSGSTG